VRPTSILVAVPVRLYGDALAAALDREAAIDVVGTCACQDEMIRGLRELKPDVVLLDPALPGDGSLTRALSTLDTRCRVIVLPGSSSTAAQLAEASGGAFACVFGDARVAELVHAVRRIALGDRGSVPADTRLAKPEPRLTARELEIVTLIDDGLSNKEIASELSIELPTVKNHVHHVLEKLAVSRRGQAVAHLRHAGLLH
jgi:two-component system, NarL family, nitrate/nitrite response regulator NarL